MDFILIEDKNIAKKYSEIASQVLRHQNGYGLLFKFKTAPKDGLADELAEFEKQGKIFEYRLDQQDKYYSVFFEIPLPDENTPIKDGEFEIVMEIAATINKYFPATHY